MVSKTSTTILAALLVLAIIPLATAALRGEAQLAGWHEVLYADEITPADDATNLRFRNVNGLTRMIIENGGDVGIGTNNPTSKLHVAGEILSTSRVRAQEVCIGNDCQSSWPSGDLSGTGADTRIPFFSGTNTLTTDANFYFSSGALYTDEICLGTTCRTTWPTAGQVFGTGNADEVAFFNAQDTLSSSSNLIFDGNQLGIGKTPTAQLDVAGSAQVGNQLNVDGESTLLGNVGIGTSTPRENLEIVGESYYSTPSGGPILTHGSGSCFRIRVDTSQPGNPVRGFATTCPGVSALSAPVIVNNPELQRTPTIDRIYLDWSPVSGAEEYIVSWGSGQVTVPSSQTYYLYQDTIGVGETYAFTVQASSTAAGPSPTSTFDTFTVRYERKSNDGIEFYCSREYIDGRCKPMGSPTTDTVSYPLGYDTDTRQRFCSLQNFVAGTDTAMNEPGWEGYQVQQFGFGWELASVSDVIQTIEC